MGLKSPDQDKRKSIQTQMRDLLHARGWCFVRLPTNMRFDKSMVKALHAFFDESAESKARYEAPFGYGYSTVDHKDGLRLLTGSRIASFMQKPGLPQNLQQPIQNLCNDLDNMFLYVFDEIADMMGVQQNEMALKADLPVAFISESHFGMLDITHYFNNKASSDPQPAEGSSVDEVNCVPHFDPGLVSISFFSDCEGLQLKDPDTGEWFNGPLNTNPDQEDIGVLWLGQAAVTAFDGQLKAGIHRVVYPKEAGKPRLTAWFEACTLKQALNPEGVYEGGTVSLENLPSVGPMQVQKGQQAYDFLRSVERKLGVPIRKSMPRHEDSFKSWVPGSFF